MQKCSSEPVENTSPTSGQCGDVFWASCEWSSLQENSSNSSIASLDINHHQIHLLQEGSYLDCKLAEAKGIPPEPPDGKISELPDGKTRSRNGKRSVSYLSYENGLPHHQQESGAKEFKKHAILESNRLEDVIQCATEHQRHKLVVTSANYPFHIEWINSDWTKLCGWASEEVIGYNYLFDMFCNLFQS
jgi:hypothetical protein